MRELKAETERVHRVVLGDYITILMAEDDAGHYTLTKNFLRECGITNEILWFEDGQAILDFLYGPDFKKEGGKYVLLLDIRMPKVDGIQVLEKIKKDPELENVYVIMLTTSEDQELANRCYSLGCQAHIVKPPDKVLLRAIERANRQL